MKSKLVKQKNQLSHYTAKYTKIGSGYLGQLVEWPEVVTEGASLEDCRTSLRDALDEMVEAYQQLGKEIPLGLSFRPSPLGREPESSDFDHARLGGETPPLQNTNSSGLPPSRE